MSFSKPFILFIVLVTVHGGISPLDCWGILVSSLYLYCDSPFSLWYIERGAPSYRGLPGCTWLTLAWTWHQETRQVTVRLEGSLLRWISANFHVQHTEREGFHQHVGTCPQSHAWQTHETSHDMDNTVIFDFRFISICDRQYKWNSKPDKGKLKHKNHMKCCDPQVEVPWIIGRIL